MYANPPHTDGRTRPIRLVSVVGARPQFIKAFPFSKAARADPGFEEILVHTGQHFDANMSENFFAELGISPPRYHFDIHGGSHGAMTGRMLTAIEEVLLAEKPDAVLVYGDTNSTLAGALAAAKLSIPVVHAEAGLRSFNRDMPEEINRIVTDRMSSVLLCPTAAAVENLAREGITQSVYRTGDLMQDATILATGLAAKHSNILRSHIRTASDKGAWIGIFSYYNEQPRGLHRSYLPGEVVAVKVNLNNSSAAGPGNIVNVSQQVCLAMVRQFAVQARDFAPGADRLSAANPVIQRK